MILLDCDTLVVQDLTPFLQDGVFRAKIADFPTVPNETFNRLFQHFALPLPPSQYRTTFNGVPTIWYCNSGVLVFPVDLVSRLVPIWREYNLKLAGDLGLLTPHESYCDQASLSLAFTRTPVPFSELPVCMNFPLHLTNLETPPEMVESDPVILHYHDRVDAQGYLLPSPYPKAQKKIDLFNDRLRESREKHFNNRVFWDYRYSRHPELGSGIGSRGDTLIYKRELVREFVDTLQPQSILDVGCGDLAVSAELPDERYTGIDISPLVIQQNQETKPRRRFICGDFVKLEVEPADLILCFDVLIHLSDRETYEAFVKRLVGHADKWGLVAGYEQNPNEGKGMVFYHEPLSSTLRRFGARNIQKCGEYNKVTVYYFGVRPFATIKAENAARVTQGNELARGTTGQLD